MSKSQRPVAVYARISVEDENVPKVEHQVAACMALAAEHGLQVGKETFVDNGIPATGKSIREGTRHKRPRFDALLQAVERGEYSAIVSVAGDRLARNYPDGLDIVDACAAGDATLLLDDDGVLDPRTPAGEERAMSLFTGGRREIRARSAKQRRRYDAETIQGMPLWGRRPFGFDGLEEVNRHGKVSRRWVLHNPVEAQAIQEAVADFLSADDSRNTPYAIARKWNALGLRTTAAEYTRRTSVTGGLGFTGDWTMNSVKGILRNPRNAGLVVRGGVIQEGVTAAWEPIISREEWQDVVDKLSDPKRRTNRGRKPHSLGSGLVLCVCGLPMRATTIKGKPRNEHGEIDASADPVKLSGLRCDVNRNLTRERMDVARHVSVRDDVLNPLLTAAVVDAFLFGPADLLPTGSVDIRPIERELSALRESRIRLVGLVARELVEDSDVESELRAIKVREGELEAQRAEAVSKSAQAAMVVDLRADLWSGERISLAKAAGVKTQLRERFESRPLAQRRELVRLLLDVRIMPGQGVKVDPERRVIIKHKVVTSLNDCEPLSEGDEDAA